jgi:hypothetical protein
MFFLHIVDDYYLQGILAQMKQKSWWEKNAPDPLYKNDYKVALIEHAFSWTFMIMLPITVLMVVNNNILIVPWTLAFVVNWIVHGLTDHLKANAHNISLVTDQITHVCQIIATCCLMTEIMEIL